MLESKMDTGAVVVRREIVTSPRKAAQSTSRIAVASPDVI